MLAAAGSGRANPHRTLQKGRVQSRGLRGGGACFYYGLDLNLPAVRRKGRWLQDATLEHYLQEGFALQALYQIPAHVKDNVTRLEALYEQFFLPPRTSPPALRYLTPLTGRAACAGS